MNKTFDKDMIGTFKIHISGLLRIFLVGLLVLIQLFFVFLFTYWLRGTFVYIYFAFGLASIVIAIILVNDNRSSSYKLAWVFILMIFPFTGHIMFALWGNLFSKKRMEKKIVKHITQTNSELFVNEKELREEFANKHPGENRISQYLENNQLPLFKNNSLTYYPTGEEIFEDIIKDIKKAEKYILINFFIVAEGVLWDKIHKILLERIDAGVEVKFMYDDFGATLRTPKHFNKELEAEGIEVAIFNPIHRYTDKLYMNYRSHQKIVVIDGNIAYTGGINIADEYINAIERFGRWKDTGIRVEGDAAWAFTVTFLQMWELCGKLPKIDYNKYRATKKMEVNDVFCHVGVDGPANNPNNPIESLYKQMIYHAKKYVYIMTPYLVIEDDVRDALMTAAKCGVDVRILTPYIPDKKNVKILTNYNYGPLLEAGVKIYEFKPGFIHGKMIINEESGFVGTVNMDYRSFYLHYECGLWFCDKETLNCVYDDMINTIEECIEIHYNEWKNRPWYLKVYQYVLNLFATLI